jgi:hypothetical protein
MPPAARAGAWLSAGGRNRHLERNTGRVSRRITDALVEEAAVGASSLQAFFQGALAGGEDADALPERGILGADPADSVTVVLVLGAR